MAFSLHGQISSSQAGLLKHGFLFERSPFPTNHSSTIVETKTGLLAAWASGPQARHASNSIWSARYDGTNWSKPIEVVNGVAADGRTRLACWNPVLFQPSNGPLLLFYKVGASPETWSGSLLTSTDNGRTWSSPTHLPQGMIGPVRNKPVELPDGSLLCGSSTEANGWVVHMERALPLGKRWERTGPLNDPRILAAIQPTILVHGPETLQILCRTQQGFIAEAWSHDTGKTWDGLKPTSLSNPNSAIDAVRLKDGRFLLVHNHSATERSVLNVSVSKDGNRWQIALMLENQPGEFSYPAVIQTGDGLVHITYSWNRQRIRHAVIDPARLKLPEDNR